MRTKFIIGLKKGVTMGVAYFPFAFTFGIMARQLAFSPFKVSLMSAILYAGSSQVILVKLLATNSPLIQTILAGIVVNIRYTLINTAVIKKQKEYRFLPKFLSSMLLTDESVSYLTITKTFNVYETLGFGFSSYLFFVVSSVVGAVVGNFIPRLYTNSLNFALYAVFVYLLTQCIITNIRYTYIIIFTLITKYILTYFDFSQSSTILFSILIGTSLSLLFKEKINGKS